MQHQLSDRLVLPSANLGFRRRARLLIAGTLMICGLAGPLRAADTLLEGYLLREVYTNITGTAVADLTNHVKFPDSPDFIGVLPTFEVPGSSGAPNDYGQRVSGYLVPNQTGDYVFYIAADDQAYLYLSTDEDPSNKRLIAAEPEWNNSREYITGSNGNPGFGRFVPPGAPDRPANVSTNVAGTITLEAGNRYYVEVLHKEGGGGDFMAVTWKLASSTVAITNGAPPIGGQFLATTFTPLLPLDWGQSVNGFQDDFRAPTLGPNWVFVGAETNQIYSLSSGMIRFTSAGGDPNHLLLDAPYNRTNQEVLARMRVVNFGTGDAARAGVAVGVGTNSQGINLHFRDHTQDNLTGRQVKLLDDQRAWGPGYDLRPNPFQTNKWQNNVWYWVRLKQEPNLDGTSTDILGKVWRADGTIPEPADWQVSWDRYPAATVREGLAGIAAGSISGVSVFDVDYILIKADGLPSITVGQPPQGRDDSLGTVQNQPATISTTKLLANDFDLEGGILNFTGAGPATAQGGTVSFTAASAAYSIGLNFGASQANGRLDAAAVAGAPGVAQANWNNLDGQSGSTNEVVATADGTSENATVTVQWASNGLWSSTGVGEENNQFAGPDRTLLTGYLDTGNATTTSVTITGLPAQLTNAGYDVYVYTLGGVAAGRSGGYRILDAATGAVLKDYVFGTSPTNPRFHTQTPVSTNPAAPAPGTYIVFSGVTASGIVVEATTANGLGGSSTPRAPINAVQLVTPSGFAGNSVTYTPPPGFTGIDSFYYTIANQDGDTGFGVVYVYVAAPNVPSFNLVGVERLASGVANVRFAGIPGRTYTVQASTDLVTWTNIGTVAAAANGLISIQDQQGALFDRRFYRTLAP